MKELKNKYRFTSGKIFPGLFRITYYVLLIFIFSSCQKELKLKFDASAIKQVLIANFTSNNYLYLSISKSKQPDDFNPVEFLRNNKVDLYENDVFIETLSYILKDTLSGLGYYTSSFKLRENRTYKVISMHDELGVAIAEEYLPPYPTNSLQVTLLQHADTAHPNVRGKYLLTFQDSSNTKNYYTVAVFYKAVKVVVDSNGVSSNKTDYLYNVPSYNTDVPNYSNYYKSFFTDASFNGQLKTYLFDFSSEYDNYFTDIYNFYNEIFLLVEFTGAGPGYYNWYYQQLPIGDEIFNDGQNERINISSNIQNGYGHFSGFSSTYTTIKIK